ncbi:hypothetical protein [Corynebacterium spheniscorum]|uniref:Uncharacterized protein n=1 Tax=Corynebacterium spheniscorum TaxID=185761 RepID=A0A1I2TP39_9CORY|nr:hypothetical protein [Corynebacterium spheniscorum]SFG64101.1 hypothetical protein SAMN05660282_01502 [Corynebacterium spheniscorum]
MNLILILQDPILMATRWLNEFILHNLFLDPLFNEPPFDERPSGIYIPKLSS